MFSSSSSNNFDSWKTRLAGSVRKILSFPATTLGQRLRVPSLIGLSALGMVACEGGTVANIAGEPQLVLQACETSRGETGPVLKGAQCGQLAVPENPDEPDGRQIQLNILRLPAIASSPQVDPLFVFAGGPGQAATDLVARLPTLFREVNRDRDVVFVDQRGTGNSNPLDCMPEESIEFSLPPDQSLAVQEQLLRECLADYDADLRYYTTPFAMDDINRVRQALGYGLINLWGGSYGTRAALVYMRRHPDSVRAAVLDSVAPFAIQLPHHAAVDADNALRRLFAVCGQEPDCRQRYPDLETRTRELISGLNRNPRLLELEHPLTRDKLRVHMSGELFAGLIRLALYERDLGPILPLIITSAAGGDFRAFGLLLTLSQRMADSLSLGMQRTILCAEDVRRPAPAAVNDHQSILPIGALEQMERICAFWPESILPPDYFEPVVSDAPVLLVSGELDPVTPPRWGDLAAQTLPNGMHIRVPGAHHGASHSGCVDELIVQFIDDGGAQNLDIACVEAVRPLPPFTSSAGPAMTRQEGQAADD
jgi:pimeloyl-ACP methyl ester carboxylesterase